MSAASKGSQFDVDVARRILMFRIWGLWDQADLTFFQQEIKEHIKRLGPGPWCVYADITEYPPQPDDIARGIQEMMGLAAHSGMIKAAHLIHASKSEIQVKRLAEQIQAPNFHFFRSAKEAIAWLMDKQAAA
jgi:hypothetical protein